MSKKLGIILSVVYVLIFVSFYIAGGSLDNQVLTWIGIIGLIIFTIAISIIKSLTFYKNKKFYFTVAILISSLLFSFFLVSNQVLSSEIKNLSNEQSILDEKYWDEEDQSKRDEYFDKIMVLESRIDELKSREGLFRLLWLASYLLVIVLPDFNSNKS